MLTFAQVKTKAEIAAMQELIREFTAWAFTLETDSDEAPTFETIKQIRSLFLHPKTTDDYSLTWSLPDTKELMEYLGDDFQFSKKRIESMLEKFEPIKELKKQQTLF